MLDRRQALLAMAGGISAALCPDAGFAADPPPSRRTPLGICLYSLLEHWRSARPPKKDPESLRDPVNFLRYCHRLGAGGIQIEFGKRDKSYCHRLRKEAEKLGMFLEGIVSLPRTQTDLNRFEAEVITAKDIGARVIRVVMIPGRRYETYQTLGQFQQALQKGRKSLERAEPVAARHRIHLAVENHKDQRTAERLELIQRISSEYVGICVDTGNSLALLEDPLEVVRAFAPYAYTVHLKDQAVQEYEDGFLLADIPLGRGILDLPAMVRILREKQPDVEFTLEHMTRDPLKVPCLTESYWRTFGDVPGHDLARTLRMVRQKACPASLPKVSHLPLEERLRQEEDNVKKCLAYARRFLKNALET
jgi:sugar phosphate isomerase/epimerase